VEVKDQVKSVAKKAAIVKSLDATLSEYSYPFHTSMQFLPAVDSMDISALVKISELTNLQVSFTGESSHRDLRLLPSIIHLIILPEK